MKKLALTSTIFTVIFVIHVSSFAQNSWQEREKVKSLPVQETNRPLRTLHYLTLTVGQTEGDMIGKDDKIIQAGIEYLNRLGGGTLRILPGVYNIKNAIYLHPNITIKGSGENTVLKMSPGFVTPIIRNIDGLEYGVQVKDPSGFTPGRGIMLRTTEKEAWAIDVLKATVTKIDGDIIYFDKIADKDFHLKKQCTAATIFPIITAENADNVNIEDIVLDGNKEQNEHINGNFSGALFLHYCNNWNFKNVTAKNYNGDGFSWQTCNDIHFDSCKALNNTDLGFHPGTGAQRPIITNCIASGNSQGIYFCWSVTDGFVDNCTFSENVTYGISIGHRDTDNIIRNCLVENNKETGILFRKDGDDEFFAGNRNLIKNCTIRDNGTNKEGIGIDIRWKTKDITIENTKFINSQGGNQKIGIQISKDAERINTSGNTFENIDLKIKNLLE
jgi:parallel beta-helix repeat protein